MHAAGLRSLADVIVDELEFQDREGRSLDDDQTWAEVRSVLELIAPSIAWTDADAGAGNESQRENWKQQISRRQNTSQDIAELITFLKRSIKKARKVTD